MGSPLDPEALSQLFDGARTFKVWEDDGIDDDDIRRLYEMTKWGPTSANSTPARFVWVRSAHAKEELASLAAEPNRQSIRTAPLTVIVGYDMRFADWLPKLVLTDVVPPERVAALQALLSKPGVSETTALRNSSLQAAYLFLAARALGYDCGPMSGFDNAGVDQAFFAGTDIRSNLICCIGHGKTGTPYPRAPRLSFEEAGRVA
jgi:3-hydroxypropanoate dehydrogenase